MHQRMTTGRYRASGIGLQARFTKNRGCDVLTKNGRACCTVLPFSFRWQGYTQNAGQQASEPDENPA